MTVYAPHPTEVPVQLTAQEIRALLDAVRELPYYAAGQTSAADKLRTALKGAGA